MQKWTWTGRKHPALHRPRSRHPDGESAGLVKPSSRATPRISIGRACASSINSVSYKFLKPKTEVGRRRLPANAVATTFGWQRLNTTATDRLASVSVRGVKKNKTRFTSAVPARRDQAGQPLFRDPVFLRQECVKVAGGTS